MGSALAHGPPAKDEGSAAHGVVTAEETDMNTGTDGWAWGASENGAKHGPD